MCELMSEHKHGDGAVRSGAAAAVELGITATPYPFLQFPIPTARLARQRAASARACAAATRGRDAVRSDADLRGQCN